MPPLHPWLASGQETTQAAAAGGPSPRFPSEWLFAASREPVLIVNAASGNIIHANPAAALLVRANASELIGTKFVSQFDSASIPEVLRGLAEAESTGHAKGLLVRTAHGGHLVAGLSLVRLPPDAFVLVRLSRSDPRLPVSAVKPASTVFAAVDAAPMAFLITDATFKIRYANRAFLRLIGAEAASEVSDNSLLQWLGLTAADMGRLKDRLTLRQAAEVIATVIQPYHGASRPVELCAVPVPDGINTQWGFTLRVLPTLN